jgi:hypothetical protein
MGVHEMLSRIRNRPLQLSLVSAVMPDELNSSVKPTDSSDLDPARGARGRRQMFSFICW